MTNKIIYTFYTYFGHINGQLQTTPRLAFGSIAELFSAVSEKRLELVRHLAGDEGLQIRPLARSLAWDYKNVHTDA